MMKMFALDFADTTTYIVFFATVVFAVVACMGAYILLNKIPAKWLCDYDEDPGEELLGQRYNFKQSGIITSALFAITLALNFVTFGYSLYTVFTILIAWALLLITLSDGKFTIIPDQFTALLAVFCLGFAVYDLFTYQVFVDKWWSILLGAVCGGGFIMVINLLSVLIFKKLGMGFGDVKLMLAIGLIMGFPRIFLMILTAVVVAFVYVIFLVIKKIITKSDELGYFPFGPFICTAAILNIVLYSQVNSLVDMYLGLIGI